MAEFKNIPASVDSDSTIGSEAAEAALTDQMIWAGRPLFEDRDFDIETEGGIGILQDGRIFELRHPYWKPGSTVAERALILPYHLSERDEIIFSGPAYDPSHPTMGGEFEINVSHQGTPWKLSEDGIWMQWPDGEWEKLSNFFDPEGLSHMAEFSSEVASDIPGHRRNVIRKCFDNESLLEMHELESDGLSLFAYETTEDMVSRLPFVRKINEYMHIPDFAVLSDQLTVQAMSPEAAQFALNEYQLVQAVVSLITAAAPIRNGSFDTTIGQLSDNLPTGDYAGLYTNEKPYDWREIARVTGSISSGSFRIAAPVDSREFLRRADSQLRDASIPTSGRTLGWHTDRFREQGRIEICNIGTAGGNLNKVLAAHELVAKFMVAEQLRYAAMTEADRQAAIDRHQQGVELGHINNIHMALHGKDMLFELPDGGLAVPYKILQDMLYTIHQHAPEPMSAKATRELMATLSSQQPEYPTIPETFKAFFAADSKLTASEAIRHAHTLEPDVTIKDLLYRFSLAKRRHVYELAIAAGMVSRRTLRQHAGLASLASLRGLDPAPETADRLYTDIHLPYDEQDIA